MKIKIQKKFKEKNEWLFPSQSSQCRAHVNGREYNIEIKTGDYNIVFLARDKVSRTVCKMSQRAAASPATVHYQLSANTCRLTTVR